MPAHDQCSKDRSPSSGIKRRRGYESVFKKELDCPVTQLDLSKRPVWPGGGRSRARSQRTHLETVLFGEVQRARRRFRCQGPPPDANLLRTRESRRDREGPAGTPSTGRRPVSGATRGPRSHRRRTPRSCSPRGQVGPPAEATPPRAPHLDFSVRDGCQVLGIHGHGYGPDAAAVRAAVEYRVHGDAAKQGRGGRGTGVH